MSGLSRRHLLAAMGSVAALRPALSFAVAEEPVALRLMLALDASASVDAALAAFEVQAHIDALRSDAVQSALLAGGVSVAISAVAFSGPDTMQVLVPWTRAGDSAGVDAIAEALEAAPLALPPGATALGSLLQAARGHLAACPWRGGRAVLDVVSNGFNNSGIAPEAARDAAVAAGITVNALALPGEFPWLPEYFTQSVIGGPNAFARAVAEPQDVTAALMAKLVTEIADAYRGPDCYRGSCA